MIAAIPLSDNSKEATVSDRFARSPYFALVFTTTKEVAVVANPCLPAKARAGNCVVDFLTNNYRVNAFIATDLGWKIQQLAADQKIQIVLLKKARTKLSEILALMKI